MRHEYKKIRKMNELSWLLGIILCALGVCLCTKANFGLSMISAPSYIIHMKLNNIFNWYTQGTSEYIWQGILLILMCILIQRFKWKYMLSFVTAMLFGIVLDGWLFIFGGGTPYEAITIRIIAFAAGELITALSIALFFKTYLPVQISELIVTEVANCYHLNKHKIKLIYDISMLILSLLLTLILNKGFIGVGVGTIIISAINAPLINLFEKILDKIFTFEPIFPKIETVLSDNNSVDR